MCAKRAIATILDHTLILEVLAFIVNVTPILNPSNSVSFDNHFDSKTVIDPNGFGGIVVVVGYIAYFSLLESWFGSTIFKRLFGIRVVDVSRNRVSLGRATIRTITKPFEFFPLFWPFSIGWIVISPSHCRFGDSLAGTTVVPRTALRADSRVESFCDVPEREYGRVVDEAILVR